ncbi:hypothetical protein SAMN06265379_101775 [Saccharicrinis carchari]|uniref:DUF4157 domain-containing protein n=1 Tax=Saccharicrinis carchari TaxID=1168039 RepID=A0A521B7R7_SACCC|nr:hypothetical protein [Saccharicrinis carchari]SMO43138.1 hypothetical protein SAMN06265379_101775 [Saccharicrinis carchari]
MARGTGRVTNRATYFIEGYINKLGDLLSYIFEVPGCAVFDMFSWIGAKVGVSFPFLWLGSVAKSLLCFFAIVVKIPFGIAGGIVSGVIKIVLGLFSFAWTMVLEGIQDVLSPVVGAFILLVAKLIALVQTIFYLQDFERRITINEEMKLNKVFAHSMSLYNVRIIEGRAGLYGLNSRAFTLGNTIYLKTKSFSIDLLIHETVHAWQYQKSGCRYASDAIIAQWFVEGAYDWEMGIKVRGKQAWIYLNEEAQAEFMQDLWKRGKLCDKDNRILKVGDGCYFDADEKKTFGKFSIWFNDYSRFAASAVNQLQKRWP